MSSSSQSVTPRVYKQCSGWGRRVQWRDMPDEKGKGRIDGHYSPRPRVGDEFHSDMESGRVGVYKITAVDLCSDPRDMFFADVKWKGYLDA